MRNPIGMFTFLLGSVMLLGCETGIGGGHTDPPSPDGPPITPPNAGAPPDDQRLIGPAFAAPGDSVSWHKCWSQYQGDPESSGFLLVGSEPVGEVKWRRLVGEVRNGSPVIGPDGTIYVGTAEGELVAIAANGQERWRRDFFPDAAIFSTPAVAADGSIFVVYSQQVDEETVVSTLNRVSPDGRWLWARLVGEAEGFTTASPKVLGEYVYLTAFTPYHELLVFDFDANIVARDRTTRCTPVCGNGIDFGDVLDGLDSVFDFACHVPIVGLPSCLLGWESPFLEFDASGAVPAYTVTDDPTVAVSDRPGLSDDGNPLVVVLNGFCMTAYRFNAPELEFLWRRRVYGGGCDDKPVRHTSPGILANGQLVICNETGEVESYDPLTGDQLWDHDAGEPVRAPAVSIGRQVYVISENYAHVIDYNGDPIDVIPLSTPTRSMPAASASFLYAVTTETVHSIDFQFETRVTDHRIDGGTSSPAIGPDGTLYVVNTAGDLIAYGESETVPGAVGSLGGDDQVAAP